MSWKNADDLERDMMIYAEMTTKKDTKVRTPDALRRYRQLTENNARMINGDYDSNVTCVISGRGRGVKDRIVKPGQDIEVLPMDERDLKQQIREVCGLGYSNALIEKSFKNRMSPRPSNSKETETPETDNSPRLSWVVEKSKTPSPSRNDKQKK